MKTKVLVVLAGAAMASTAFAQSSMDRDRAYAAELKRAGFQPKVVVEEGVYRVQLGRFESREAARAFQRRFRHESGRADAGFVTEY